MAEQNPQAGANDASADATSAQTARPTSGRALMTALAWLVVAVPAAWGISQTVQTSLRLFNSHPAASPPPTQPAR